jgi:lycopene beta-cyclase
MQTESDILILGGGCAGLSLALRLAADGENCPTTVILESRSHYSNDRTWCFWDDGSAHLRELVQHRWPMVTLAHGGRRVRVDCQTIPYAMIPAENFYAHATKKLAETARVALAMNEPVLGEPRKESGLWRVETRFGLRWAKLLVDTRPQREPARGAAVLWQSFCGQEIECEADRFDPGVAGLMDFSPSRNGRITFLYLLPFSPRRALVEVTVLAPDPLGPEDLAEELASFIRRQVGGSSHAVLRFEHGVLPMGQDALDRVADVSRVRVGVAAGGARAASGFAFQRIQRWANACAAELIAGRPPLSHPPDPWITRAMDALFLRVLRAHPERAPELFLALFALQDPRRIIRFMSDHAAMADYAAIIVALPPWLFLREIPRVLWPRPSLPEGDLNG